MNTVKSMWVEVHETLTTHKKIRKLSIALGFDKYKTIGHLVSLWIAVRREDPDGFLLDWDEYDIAECAGVDTEPKLFVENLIKFKLIDKLEDGTLAIHNRTKYTKYDKRAKDREKDRLRKTVKSNSEPIPDEFRTNSEPIPDQKSEFSGTNIIYNNIKETNVKEKTKKAKKEELHEEEKKFFKEINEVVNQYTSYFPSNKIQAKSKTNRSKIRARLTDGYAVDDLINAINGASNDQWCIDNKVNGISHIFKNASNVDKYKAKARFKPKPSREKQPLDDKLNQLAIDCGIGDLESKQYEIIYNLNPSEQSIIDARYSLQKEINLTWESFVDGIKEVSK